MKNRERKYAPPVSFFMIFFQDTTYTLNRPVESAFYGQEYFCQQQYGEEFSRKLD